MGMLTVQWAGTRRQLLSGWYLPDIFRCTPGVGKFSSGEDVTAQIVAMLKKQTFNETFTHVKGHQDKDKKYNELSLPTRLNIDVDALAVEFCCE
eukprot:8605145-Ditylum_brightwellii.AAC.1